MVFVSPKLPSDKYNIISPLAFNSASLFSVENPISTNIPAKNEHEIFGFGPYWNFDKMDKVDFSALTTFAYFDIPVDGQGNMDTGGPGYQTFISKNATELFEKAHKNGTRVVVTFTQMNNGDINALMENEDAQNDFINNSTNLVKNRGLDGINVDFEYTGDSGPYYRNQFSRFVTKLAEKMHQKVPGSKVTVSVYASAVKDPKIYDIKTLSDKSDGIFMMAYDFATLSSDTAMPTSPLDGHKEGKYWYDISTAVNDFLKVMPPEKLILGLPWYGYEYPVNSPTVNAATYQGYYYYYWVGWRRYSAYYQPPSTVQTYANAQDSITVKSSGWDNYGKVGWKAYIDGEGIWRMVFMEDTKSLKLKYDFAKDKKLAGVGIWALGFEDGKRELWDLLKDEFGPKLADLSIVNKKVKDVI